MRLFGCGFQSARPATRSREVAKATHTNPLERINKELKRRSRVVGMFPNEASAIRLIRAILTDLRDDWQATARRYLSEDSMETAMPDPCGPTVTM